VGVGFDGGFSVTSLQTCIILLLLLGLMCLRLVNPHQGWITIMRLVNDLAK